MPPVIPYFSRNKGVDIAPDLGFWEDLGNSYARQYKGIYRHFNALFEDFATQQAEEDFKWYEQIEGYEDQLDLLSTAKNQEHLDYIKESIEIQRDIRAKAERGGYTAPIVAGILDPLNVGLALPIFNRGIQAAWTAKNAFGVGYETAKVAIPFAVTREAIRAPFDPYTNAAEIGTNITAEVALSGLFGFGIRGAANKIMQPKIQQSIRKYSDFIFNRDVVPDNINGVKVNNKPTGKTRPDGSKVNAYYSPTKKEIFWDKKSLIDEYPLKPWLSPKVKGVLPLPDYLFQKPEDWARFVLHHEKAHSEFPFEKLKTMYEAKNPKDKYTRADYENEINNIAIDEYSKGFMLKQTGATKNILYKMISIPGKRILNDKEVPNEIKKAYADLFFNGSISLEGNIAGIGTHGGSAAARTIPYRATGKRVVDSIRAAYLQELKGNPLESGFLGINIDALNVKLGNYGTDAKTFPDFFRQLVSFHIDMLTDPSFDMNLYHALPDKHKEALATLKAFFTDFEKALREAGKLGDDTGIRRKMADLEKNKEFHQTKIDDLNKNVVKGETRNKYINKLKIDLVATEKKIKQALDYKDKNHGKLVTREFFNKKTGRRDFTKLRYTIKMFNEDNAELFRRRTRLRGEIKNAEANPNYLGSEEFNIKAIPHQERITKIDKELEFYKEILDSPIRPYAFPHYFNKQLLINDEDARQRFKEKLIDLFMKDGGKKTWSDEIGGYKIEDAKDLSKAAELADKTILHILEDPDLINLLPRSGKRKHLMQRVLNFPTHELKEFLVLDERVIEKYANQMGFHVEFGKKMGSMDIDDILDRLEFVMMEKGIDEKKIARIKSDFLGDYEREAGIHIRDPEARSQRYIRNLESIAGMTYLPFAGITSLIDAIGMPIFRFGPKKVFKTAIDATNGDFPEMLKMGKQLRDIGGEAIENEVPIVQYRYLSDSVRDIQPRLTERVIQGAEKVFYKANFLSQITATAKQFDNNILISTFYERGLKIKNKEAIIEGGKDITDSVIEDLGRYGISPQMVVDIIDSGGWYLSPKGNGKIDVTKMADNTVAERDLKMSFITYMGTHARNTIMNATAFDKPMMMNGFMYVRMNPILKMMGKQPDPRASTANIKMVRLESAVFGLPFKFLNFVFAATNRITMNMFDPNVQNRLTGIIALMGMSYLVLKLKKPDFWFENRSFPDLVARIFDQSGIGGLYTDLAYHAIHSAIANGYYNNNTAWIKGKFEPTVAEDIFDKFGATPSMIREWTLGAYDLVTGSTNDGLQKILRNTPVIGLYGLNRDMEYMFKTRY